MVYVKKGFKKRYYNRRRYALKKNNIFKYKSAKSQAKQIYALNKKVNKIAYQFKPEVYTPSCVMFKRHMTTDGTSTADGVSEWHTNIQVFKNNLFAADKCNYLMKGDNLRPYNFTIYGNFGNKNLSYVVNSGTEASSAVDVPLTGYLRIVVCKLVGQQYFLPLQVTQSFDPNANDYGLINGPLIKDVSRSLKIVKNMVIKVDQKDPQKMFKITVKNPGVISAGAGTGTYVPSTYNNDYMVYFQYWIPDAIVDDFHQVAPKHYLECSVKFAFADTE